MEHWTRRTGVRAGDVRAPSGHDTKKDQDETVEKDVAKSWFSVGDSVEIRDQATGSWIEGRIKNVSFVPSATIAPPQAAPDTSEQISEVAESKEPSKVKPKPVKGKKGKKGKDKDETDPATQTVDEDDFDGDPLDVRPQIVQMQPMFVLCCVCVCVCVCVAKKSSFCTMS